MRALSFILALVYAVFVFTPLVPFIEYSFDYDVIVQEKCVNKDSPEMECNGKCHLKKQIEKQDMTTRVPKEAQPFAYYELMQWQHATDIEVPHIFEVLRENIPVFNDKLPDGIIGRLFRPPG